MSKLPVFDPEKDGNPFDWIVKTAQRVRAVKQSNAETARLLRRLEARETAKLHDAIIEAQEAERFKLLRKKFPRRSGGDRG